jgi:hypothetical protein
MRKSWKSGVGSRKLKWNSLLTIVFVLVLAACNSGAKKAQPAQTDNETGVAKFVFSEELHNFGSLTAGEIVAYTFTFRNEGTKSLTIKEVKTSCGCTEVKVPNKSIGPGEEGYLEVIYNSAGETGKQLHTITIFSDAEQPEKQLFIRATVTNELIEIYS